MNHPTLKTREKEFETSPNFQECHTGHSYVFASKTSTQIWADRHQSLNDL